MTAGAIRVAAARMAGIKAGRGCLSVLAGGGIDMSTSISFTAQEARGDRPPAGCRPTKRTAAVLLASVLTLSAIGQAMAAESGGYQVVGGVKVYLDVLPSEMLKDRVKAGPEATMHGGPPGGEHAHHVVVALFDARTGQRITDADVQATVREIGLGGPTKRLEAMPMADALTYGNYFEMRTKTRYRVVLDITAPGRTRPLKARFEYDHE